jgi:hypothetical protein
MIKSGFYSVVHLVPDFERAEAVNVGVIVGAPGVGIRVRMAERNEYVKQRFGAEAYDDTRLGLAKSGLAERLKDVEPSAEALAAFCAQEAGQLQLTPPRWMVVMDLDDEVTELFLRLVQDPEAPRVDVREPRMPFLEYDLSLIDPEEQDHPAWKVFRSLLQKEVRLGRVHSKEALQSAWRWFKLGWVRCSKKVPDFSD